MAILGPLAFRANKWHEGLKVASPLWREFVWEQPLVWADCEHLADPEKYEGAQDDWDDDERCSYNKDLHIVPGRRHSCGIYATISRDTLMCYFKEATHVVYLVEAWGDYWLCQDRYSAGFRSSGAQIVHIVNTARYQRKIHKMEHDGEFFERRINAQNISALAAAHKFNVSLIEWDVAIEMCQIMWAKAGMEWPWKGGL